MILRILCAAVIANWTVVAEIRVYDPVIPIAFEENRGQAFSQFQHFIAHQGIGFSCQAMYWPSRTAFGLNIANPEPVTYRINGAPEDCYSQLAGEDGSRSHYYRGSPRSVPNESRRFNYLRYRLPQADVEYSSNAGALIARFSFRSVEHLRALRLTRSAGNRSVTSLADGWKVRTSRGDARQLLPGESDRAFDVTNAGDESQPIDLFLEVPLQKTSLAGVNGMVQRDGKWYGTGFIFDFSQYDSAAVVCTYSAYNQRCPDTFVAEFDRDGRLHQIFYFLGNSLDSATLVTMDSSGALYVAGTTYSSDFVTTPGILQQRYAGPLAGPGGPGPNTRRPGGDVFLVKLDVSTGRLFYATYFGLSDIEYPRSLHVDDFGRTYLGVSSASANFPTSGEALTEEEPCQFEPPSLKRSCNFLVSFDENASAIRYSKRSWPAIGVLPSGEAFTADRRISVNGDPIEGSGV